MINKFYLLCVIFSGSPDLTLKTCLVYVNPPSRRCLHFGVVGGLEWSNDPESYAGGSIATGRASLAGKVKGDESD